VNLLCVFDAVWRQGHLGLAPEELEAQSARAFSSAEATTREDRRSADREDPQRDAAQPRAVQIGAGCPIGVGERARACAGDAWLRPDQRLPQTHDRDVRFR
jgi:hypothetical protein